MARERAKLSEKQERILVQAQLMGLTARDMQQIGNRLIALQAEAEAKQEISESIHGYSWEQIPQGWKVITPDGFTITAKQGKKSKINYWSSEYGFNIIVTKPGTRFKPRTFQDKMIVHRNEWKKKLMPENSKSLYGIIRWARDIQFEI